MKKHYRTQHQNDATVMVGKDYQEIRGAGDSVTVSPDQYQNIPMAARQLGATVSVNYVVNKFQIKPFVAFQQTRLYDYTDLAIRAMLRPALIPKRAIWAIPLRIIGTRG